MYFQIVIPVDIILLYDWMNIFFVLFWGYWFFGIPILIGAIIWNGAKAISKEHRNKRDYLGRALMFFLLLIVTIVFGFIMIAYIFQDF
ncbi:MAG: hypothetical protein H6551_13080 [Chitinophagales bacterium]|nr:hypothetical protein [Chitinophagaceae bacterium]MCB9066066.1 hypothetical protein [Chitinophagales bacterium]